MSHSIQLSQTGSTSVRGSTSVSSRVEPAVRSSEALPSRLDRAEVFFGRSADELWATFESLRGGHANELPSRERTGSTPHLHPVPLTRRWSENIRDVPLASSASPLERPRPSFDFGSLSRPKPSFGEADAEELEEESSPNPFALPPPAPGSISRFDPKALSVLEGRRSEELRAPTPMSSRDQLHPNQLLDEPLRSASTGPSDTASPSDGPPSAFPEEEDTPKSAGPVYADIPSPTEYGRPLIPARYGPRPWAARVRFPKTLIMPAPLETEPSPPSPVLPDGWILGSRPLPAEARSSILRQVAQTYVATERERLHLEDAQAEEERLAAAPPTDRRPGRLIATSLLDQLELRKRAVKSRQRQFRGDSRPAMMTRFESTIPEEGVVEGSSRPTTMHTMQSGDYGLSAADGRPTSFHPSMFSGVVVPKKSVFGHDALWEREMEKRRVWEAQEAEAQAKRDEEGRVKREAAEAKLAAKREKEGKRRSKWKGKDVDPAERPVSVITAASVAPSQLPLPVSATVTSVSPSSAAESTESIGPSPTSEIGKLPDAPPVLDYQPGAKKAYVPDPHAPRRPKKGGAKVGDWLSSDEEDGAKRRLPAALGTENNLARPVLNEDDDESSDEDVPLTTFIRVTAKDDDVPLGQRALRSDSSEEDIPLSKYIPTARPAPLPLSFETGAPLTLDLPSDAAAPQPSALPKKQSKPQTTWKDEKDDDDVPLGARFVEAPDLKKANDDDVPLGYKIAGISPLPSPTYHPPHPASTQNYPGPGPMAYGSPYVFMGHPHAQPYPGYPPYPYAYPPLPYPHHGGGPMMHPAMYPPVNEGVRTRPGENIDRWRQEVPLGRGGGSSSGSGTR